VGGAGHADLAAAHQLQFIRHSPLVARMDCLIIMPGVNDLIRLIRRLDFGEGRPPLWYRSGVADLLRELWNVQMGRGLLLDYTGETIAQQRRGGEFPARDIEPEFAAAQQRYAQTIRQIAQAAQRRNVRLIFVTQPVLWDEYLTRQGNDALLLGRVAPPREWDFLSPGPLRDAMDRYNDTLVAVARELDCECVDAALRMDGQEQYFYDDYHLSEAGSAELARILAAWIAERPPASTLRSEQQDDRSAAD
jgi:lysophospholipase L1-like esterase